MDYSGIKEIYDVVLKTTSNMEINGVNYAAGEPILTFDNLQVANLSEIVSRRTAHGGKGDETLVLWEDTKGLNINITTGVISEAQMAILYNSKVLTKEPNTLSVNKIEKNLSSTRVADNQYKLTLKYNIEKDVYVYRNGVKKTDISWAGGSNEILVNGVNDDGEVATYMVCYDFIYSKTSEEFLVGSRLINRYLRLEGKLRKTEDKDGKDKTCIIIIPQIKIMSDLRLTLGKNVNPSTFNFQMVGYPVGDGTARYVCKFIQLDDDIDCDIG